MENKNEIAPYKNETPAAFAARLGDIVTLKKPAHRKQQLGQYLTPETVAQYMAGLAGPFKPSLRILDPGAGAAVLSCAFAERLAASGNVTDIELICHEIDEDTLPYTALSLKYLEQWLSGININLRWELHETDFILDNAGVFGTDLSSSDSVTGQFDFVISNPPFFKLSKEDPRTKVASSIIFGQPNIYSIFLYIAAKLLKTNGELIFLIPGSFCSGSYFRLFRERLLELISLEEIHFSSSDEKIFHSNSVLSGSVIIRATRKSKIKEPYEVKVFHCPGYTGKPDFSYSFLFDLKENIIPLAATKEEQNLYDAVRALPGSLMKYRYEISAGNVLQSKAEKNISAVEDTSFNALFIGVKDFDRSSAKQHEKEMKASQYLQINSDTSEFLIPNRNYVIIQRYNTHKNKKGITALPYYKSSFKGSLIAIDKKLSCIYKPGGELNENEAAGLSAILNSRIVNQFLRIINGNINPGFHELSMLPLPSFEMILKAGKAFRENP